MERDRDDVYRIFGLWLELSSGPEILILLDLVLAELRKRGYTATHEIRPP